MIIFEIESVTKTNVMKKTEQLKRKLEAAKKALEPFHLKNYSGLTKSHEQFNAMRREPGYKEASEKVRKLENELKYWENREVKAYCNQHGWTDVYPYEVVRVVSEKTIEVRAMSVKQVKFPSEVHVGGFAAHVVDNRSGQEYEYESNPENTVIRCRWSEAKKQWQSERGRHSMSDQPYKFYDYNF